VSDEIQPRVIEVEAHDLAMRTSTDGGFKVTLDLGGDINSAKAVAMLGLMRQRLLKVTITEK
jgi:hypothetical protein